MNILWDKAKSLMETLFETPSLDGMILTTGLVETEKQFERTSALRMALRPG